MVIAVCDDDADFCKEISDALAHASDTKLLHLVKTYRTGAALLFDWEGNAFDLLILDIELGAERMNGLAVAEEVRKRDALIPIIFLTRHTQYALQGYEYHPYHYLLKFRYKKKLKRLIHEIEERRHRDWSACFNIKTRGGYTRIQKDDIVYIDIQNHQIRIHTIQSNVYRHHMRIGDAFNELSDARFFQPHKSFIVNLEHIHRISDGYAWVHMDNGEKVPISQGKKSAFIRYITWFDTRARGIYEYDH